MPVTPAGQPVALQQQQQVQMQGGVPVAAVPAAAAQTASARYPTSYDAGAATGGGAISDGISQLIGAASNGMNQIESMITNLTAASGDKGVDPAQMAQLNRRMQAYTNQIEMAKKIEEYRQRAIQRILQ